MGLHRGGDTRDLDAVAARECRGRPDERHDPGRVLVWNVTDGAVKRHAGGCVWEITFGASATAQVGFHGATPPPPNGLGPPRLP